MLRITPCTNASQASHYYSASDYYLGDAQELPGIWGGKAAEQLGLSGQVTREQWDALCFNLDPNTGKRLTQRTQKNRRVGYDFTFSTPKSVSLLYALTTDDRLLDAFRKSVDDTMQEVEADMKTRVRAGKEKGADGDRTTANAVWATFVHFTTRPEDGVPDPHLHGHVFVHNVTYDHEEKRFKAGQFGALKADGPYYEGVFQTNLAQRLSELGLPVERTRTGFEIVGVDRSTIRKFSRRTERIERLAVEKGITDAKEKAELGAKTRHRKDKHFRFDELVETWRSWLKPEESNSLLVAKHRLETGLNEFRDDRQAAREALQASIAHHLERASVVPERKVLGYALKQSAGSTSVNTLRYEYDPLGVVYGYRDGQRMVTTREVLEEERELIAFARAGRGTCRALAPSGYRFKDTQMSELQQRAATHLLTSSDRVMLLRGYSGVGKTRMMREVVAGIEASGKRVFSVAPGSKAARGTLREEVSPNANTLAYLLKNERAHEQLRGNVIFLDEAGQVGTKTLRELFDLAHRYDARVICAGDVRQHGAVERGAAMRLLETQAGLMPAELSIIRRQQGRYRDVVQALADGHTKEGFEQMQALGWVHEIKGAKRYEQLAHDYIDALNLHKPDKLLVIAPTHKEGAIVTQAVRSALKRVGKVGATEQYFTKLQKRDLTTAQRADPTSYRSGDVVIYTQNAPGHRKGERVTVGEHGKGVALAHADKYQVFRPTTIALAPGDRVRITHGGRTLDKRRLDNGDTFTVKGFTPEGHLQFTDGRVLDKEYGHLTYGICTTSHAAQSATVARVFIAQAKDSYPASSREQIYVSYGRGEQRADVYTDSIKDLLAAVQRSDERLTATEFVAMKAVRARTKAMQRMRLLQPVQAITAQKHREQERALQ